MSPTAICSPQYGTLEHSQLVEQMTRLRSVALFINYRNSQAPEMHGRLHVKCYLHLYDF